MSELKTSEDWQKLCQVEILDPDGWDRQNIQFSWYEELISRVEFEKRLALSTVKFNIETILTSQVANIWKDKEA